MYSTMNKAQKRDIWTADLIRKALDECDDMKLYVAMNLAFACSMRYGEIAGLTWDKLHVSNADIANDDAHLYIEQELSRVSREARTLLDDTQKFEATFYARTPNNPLRDVTPPPDATNPELNNLMTALQQSPELVAMLTQAMKGLAINEKNPAN